MDNDSNKSIGFIDIRIPWEPGKNLGMAYNRLIDSIGDWVLILDYDVLLLTVDFYDICLNAINQLGHSAGWITCRTNRIGCPVQKKNALKSNDINDHRQMAIRFAHENAGRIRDITDTTHRLSGFFVLTHKEALKSISPFPNKFLGLDNWMQDRIKEKGYRIYLMEDLYVYHTYSRDWKRKAQEDVNAQTG